MGLAPREPGALGWYAFAVGVNLVETLVIGQVPFLLGTALRRPRVPVLGPGGTGQSSSSSRPSARWRRPLTGAFLVLVLPACAVSIGTRRALALAGGLVGPVCALGLGGAAGPFPMPWLLFVRSSRSAC